MIWISHKMPMRSLQVGFYTFLEVVYSSLNESDPEGQREKAICLC